MKKYLIIIQFVLISATYGYTQLSYEGEHDANLKVFQLNDGTLKFYKIEPKENKLLIFNAENVLWKSIDLQIPKGHFINNIDIISSSQTETILLYTCYYIDYYPIEDATGRYAQQVFTLNVVDENGDYLLKIPEAMEYKLLSANGTTKLLVYKNEDTGFNGNSLVEVYGLSSH